MGSHAHCVVCKDEWRVDVDLDGLASICDDCAERPDVAAIIEVVERWCEEEAYEKSLTVIEHAPDAIVPVQGSPDVKR